MKLKEIGKKFAIAIFAFATLAGMGFAALLAYQALSGVASGTVEQGLSTLFTAATFGSSSDGGVTWDYGTLHGNDAVNTTFSETNNANRDTTGSFVVIISSDDTLTCGSEISSFAFYPNADGNIGATDSHTTDGTASTMTCSATGVNEITYTDPASTAITAGASITPEIDFSLNPLFADQTLDVQIQYN